MTQPVLERRSFADKPTLANELAEAVADRIRTAIDERGEAAIAVSGGSTPSRFFQALGKTKDIDWSKVIVTPFTTRTAMACARCAAACRSCSRTLSPA